MLSQFVIFLGGRSILIIFLSDRRILGRDFKLNKKRVKFLNPAKF